jgi:hypothetical protein
MTRDVINKGKTAFPIVGQLQDVHEVGITMLDYFAAKAMQALLSREHFLLPRDGIDVAEYAYEMAYAIAKARGEK